LNQFYKSNLLLYDDYFRGYSFLRYLGLNYVTGINNLPKLQQKEKWIKNEFDGKREILKNIKKFKPKIGLTPVLAFRLAERISILISLLNFE